MDAIWLDSTLREWREEKGSAEKKRKKKEILENIKEERKIKDKQFILGFGIILFIVMILSFIGVASAGYLKVALGILASLIAICWKVIWKFFDYFAF